MPQPPSSPSAPNRSTPPGAHPAADLRHLRARRRRGAARQAARRPGAVAGLVAGDAACRGPRRLHPPAVGVGHPARRAPAGRQPAPVLARSPAEREAALVAMSGRGCRCDAQPSARSRERATLGYYLAPGPTGHSPVWDAIGYPGPLGPRPDAPPPPLSGAAARPPRPRSTATSWSSARAPAAAPRRRCSPRPASTWSSWSAAATTTTRDFDGGELVRPRAGSTRAVRPPTAEGQLSLRRGLLPGRRHRGQLDHQLPHARPGARGVGRRSARGSSPSPEYTDGARRGERAARRQPRPQPCPRARDEVLERGREGARLARGRDAPQRARLRPGRSTAAGAATAAGSGPSSRPPRPGSPTPPTPARGWSSAPTFGGCSMRGRARRRGRGGGRRRPHGDRAGAGGRRGRRRRCRPRRCCAAPG